MYIDLCILHASQLATRSICYTFYHTQHATLASQFIICEASVISTSAYYIFLIFLFSQCVNNMSQSDRARLLQFWTGSSQVWFGLVLWLPRECVLECVLSMNWIRLPNGLASSRLAGAPPEASATLCLHDSFLQGAQRIV